MHILHLPLAFFTITGFTNHLEELNFFNEPEPLGVFQLPMYYGFFSIQE